MKPEFLCAEDERDWLRKQLAAAQQRIAELEKDAARYRWLRIQGYGGYAICKWDGGADDYFRCIAPAEMVDAAIDAALEQKEIGE